MSVSLNLVWTGRHICSTFQGLHIRSIYIHSLASICKLLLQEKHFSSFTPLVTSFTTFCWKLFQLITTCRHANMSIKYLVTCIMCKKVPQQQLYHSTTTSAINFMHFPKHTTVYITMSQLPWISFKFQIVTWNFFQKKIRAIFKKCMWVSVYLVFYLFGTHHFM